MVMRHVADDGSRNGTADAALRYCRARDHEAGRKSYGDGGT
jgi:hypothetical protein